MTEIDRVLNPIKISFEGNADISELYHLIKDFLGEKKYDIDEKQHIYSDSGSLKIKWEATQNITEYTQFQIEVSVKGSKMKKVKLKDKEAFSGNFTVEIEAHIHKDYQDAYEGKPIIKFFRELFDYTVKKHEFSAWNTQLKNESYALFDEIKSYFGLQKIQ
jgi:hypothetical protein